MTEVECTAKEWGSSLGIIIPKKVVLEEDIKPNEKVRIIIKKLPLAKDIWNLGPLRRIEPTQKIVDEMKKGW
jgi:hypothetical protein